MTFRFSNNMCPPINSIILVRINNTNIIGLVETIVDEKIYVLALDRVGRISIKKTDDWILLDISNLQSLRNSYKMFINKNIDGLVQESYGKFANNFLNK